MAAGSAPGCGAPAPRFGTSQPRPECPSPSTRLAEALGAGPFDLVALVQAESAYGILNPLEEAAALTKAHGALLVVDAVAAVGGHALDVDTLGIDVAVIGPQKALGGHAGVSALSVSAAAWARMAPSGEAPSILSLADQRALWLEAGRGALPGTPSAIEFHALAQTLARVEAEGLASIQARHRRVAAAARAGAKVLTGRDWVVKESASNLVTAVALPDRLGREPGALRCCARSYPLRRRRSFGGEACPPQSYRSSCAARRGAG